MAFKNDGSVHFKGIRNEATIVERLNKIKDQAFTDFITKVKGMKIDNFIRRGGTKYKEDAVAMSGSNEVFGITIKNHKSGTVDYLNTSNIVDYLGEEEDKIIKDGLTAIKDKFKKKYQNETDEIKKDKIKCDARTEVKKLSSNAISKINDAAIKTFLKKIKDTDPELLIVNKEDDGSVHFIKKGDRFDLNDIMSFTAKDKYELKTKKNAIESATIYKNGKDTGIRIRVVLNNGVGALLGGNTPTSKNKNAVMTLKAQNDNVSK